MSRGGLGRSTRDRAHRRATTPRWIWVPTTIAVLALAGPILALGAAAEPGTLVAAVTSPEASSAVVLSLSTSVAATVLCVLLGVPLALAVHRAHGALRALLQLVLIVPLVLSPVVSGLALLYFWGRQGIAGESLAALGLGVAYTPAAVVLVQVFVALPFVTVAALSSLEAVDPDLELAGANAGAGPTQILRHITLPLAAPGIAAGTLLAFARALGEYGATITFAGSVAGQTRTIPLQIELAFNSADPGAAVGLALMLIGFYLLVLGAVALLFVLPGRAEAPVREAGEGRAAPGIQRGGVRL
ncbi:ABC transporter permease subunit [Zhihengliuella sp.]|uniref:molybdate ABC transporter permease subunit n=1 Tax=Zhihengliuella sp. TaxID=1954483 RepID=UPI002810C845|nr:ABC transporter permease subunit [Zhihengliuella sp.]